MERLIYTYALIKSLYDQGEDYIDSFWPFVIKALGPNKSSDLNIMQKTLKDKHGLEIPLHVIGVILTRAKRRGYLTQEKQKYQLTKQGIDYLVRLEIDEVVDRRIKALCEDMQDFFKKHNYRTTERELENLLLTFLRRNIDPLIECINPSFIADSLFLSKISYAEQLLVEYIKTAEQQKPEIYETIQNMIWGSIISVVLYTEKSSDVTELESRKFKDCRCYLDTNFIFSILDLHAPEFNVPAQELFDLLKMYKFDIRIFDFTIDEICRVINAYPIKMHYYPNTIRVDTLYSGLKHKGWNKSDAHLFVADIEKILLDKGIKIEWETGIDIKNYIPQKPEIRSLLKKYKPEQDVIHQNHDWAAIDYIRKTRKKSIRRLEDASYFFLTSDVRLSRFNFIGMGHKSNSTICEVILDRLLTNILWLKNPNIKPPIKSIISAYSRNLFVKRRIWDKFYEIIRELRQTGKASEEEIAVLFYRGYIEEVLRVYDESEVDKLTPDFALAEIEKVGRSIEEKTLAIVKNKERELISTLDTAVSKKEREIEDKWIKRFEASRENLKLVSAKEARKNANIYATLICLPIAGFAYVAYFCLNKLGLWDLLKFLFPLLFGGGSLTYVWKKLREKIRIKLYEKIYLKKLKETKLESANEIKT